MMFITELVSNSITLGLILLITIAFTIFFKWYIQISKDEIKNGERDIQYISNLIYEKQEKIIRRKKIKKRLKKLAYILFLIILIPLFTISVISKLQNNVVYIGGKGMMVVASGSMSYKLEANTYLDSENLNNQFNKFDIIILQEVTPTTELKVYDVIAYRNDEGTNIIHRIVEIISDKGEIKYKTRGDAVGPMDEYHPTRDDVLGIYTSTKIDKVGILILFLQSTSGIITLVALIYCFFMIDSNTEKVKNIEYDRIEKLKSLVLCENETIKKIYYNNYIYEFDHTGCINESKIKKDLNIELEDGYLIKDYVVDNSMNILTKKILIDEKEGD